MEGWVKNWWGRPLRNNPVDYFREEPESEAGRAAIGDNYYPFNFSMIFVSFSSQEKPARLERIKINT